MAEDKRNVAFVRFLHLHMTPQEQEQRKRDVASFSAAIRVIGARRIKLGETMPMNRVLTADDWSVHHLSEKWHRWRDRKAFELEISLTKLAQIHFPPPPIHPVERALIKAFNFFFKPNPPERHFVVPPRII